MSSGFKAVQKRPNIQSQTPAAPARRSERKSAQRCWPVASSWGLSQGWFRGGGGIQESEALPPLLSSQAAAFAPCPHPARWAMPWAPPRALAAGGNGELAGGPACTCCKFRWSPRRKGLPGGHGGADAAKEGALEAGRAGKGLCHPMWPSQQGGPGLSSSINMKLGLLRRAKAWPKGRALHKQLRERAFSSPAGWGKAGGGKMPLPWGPFILPPPPRTRVLNIQRVQAEDKWLWVAAQPFF